MSDPLAALRAAWFVTVVALSLLYGTLTLASYWETERFVRAFHAALIDWPV